MAKYLPFHLDIYDHPIVKRLNPYPAGLYRLLIEDYWVTGYPLPNVEFDLQRLCKCDTGTWNRYRDKVLEAIRLTMPDIKKKRDDELRKRNYYLKSAARMRKTPARHMKRKLDVLSDDFSNHVAVNPLPEKSIWKPGHYDQTARKAAIQANKLDDGTMLSDD